MQVRHRWAQLSEVKEINEDKGQMYCTYEKAIGLYLPKSEAISPFNSIKLLRQKPPYRVNVLRSTSLPPDKKMTSKVP